MSEEVFSILRFEDNKKIPRDRKKLTNEINNLSICLSSDDTYKCCFDVCINGLKVVHNLTLGELLEFICRVFMSKDHSICYLDDFGKFDFE